MEVKPKTLEEVISKRLTEAMIDSDGRMNAAAIELGVSRSRLRRELIKRTWQPGPHTPNEGVQLCKGDMQSGPCEVRRMPYARLHWPCWRCGTMEIPKSFSELPVGLSKKDFILHM